MRIILTLVFIAIFAIPVCVPIDPARHVRSDDSLAKADEVAELRASEEKKEILEEVRRLRQDIKFLSEQVDRLLAPKGDRPAASPTVPVVPAAPLMPTPPVAPAAPVDPGSPLPVPPLDSAQANTVVRCPEVVYFTAAWAGPCQKMIPVIRKLQEEGFAIRIIDIDDIDKDRHLQNCFNVQSIPHLAIVLDKWQIDRIVGVTDEARIRELFAQHSVTPRVAAPKSTADPLFKRVTLRCVDVSFMDVLKTLKNQLGISIVIDDQSVADAGIDLSRPVTIEVIDEPGRFAFHRLVSMVGLGFQTPESRSLVVITGRAKRREQAYSATYLLPDEIAGRDLGRSIEALRDLITKTISPESWKADTGKVSIEVDSERGSLTIHQTQIVHDQITELLQQLYRLSTNTPEKPKGSSNAIQPAEAKQQSATNTARRPASQSGGQLITINYTVADLVVPHGSGSSPSSFRLAYGPLDLIVDTHSRKSSVNRKISTIRGALDLIDRIKDSVQSENWMENGGECTVMMNEATLSLVIRATEKIHEQIQELLHEIRRDRGDLIEFETTMIEARGTNILSSAEIQYSNDTGRTKSVILTDAQFDRLTQAVEKSAGTVLLTPKISTYRGDVGIATFPVDQRNELKFALRLFLRGDLTADRKRIRLNVAADPKQLINELSIQQHQLADGQRLLLDMSDLVNVDRTESQKKSVLIVIRPQLQVEQSESLATPSNDGAPSSK